jgi:hypothetical protein
MKEQIIEKIKKHIINDEQNKIERLIEKNHHLFIYYVARYGSIRMNKYFLEQIGKLPKDIDYHKLFYLLSDHTEPHFEQIINLALDKIPDHEQIASIYIKTILNNSIKHNNDILLENYVKRLVKSGIKFTVSINTFLKAVINNSFKCADVLLKMNSSQTVLTINPILNCINNELFNSKAIYYLTEKLRNEHLIAQRGVIPELVLYCALKNMNVFYYIINIFPLSTTFVLESIKNYDNFNNKKIYKFLTKLNDDNIDIYHFLQKTAVKNKNLFKI